MNFMKYGLLLLTTIAACSATPEAHAQSAEGVDVFPIDNGGLKYHFRKEGLDILKPIGGMNSDGYAVPFGWSVRTGCFAATQWFSIEHIHGNVTFFPHVSATWRGELGGPNPLTADLFNFRIERKRADGSSRTFRRYVDTSAMQLRLRATAPDGSQSYFGSLKNPKGDGGDETFGSTISVDTGDSVRLLVCDVWSGVSLTLNDIDAYSIPVVTE
jgi:hypothetical protein